MWKDDIDLTIQSYNMFHIDANVSEDCNKWRITGFYGKPDAARRSNTWELLRHLKGRGNLPWIVFGDFNEILFNSENIGGLEKPGRLMENFRDTLNDCNLIDLGFAGRCYTWFKKKLEIATLLKKG